MEPCHLTATAEDDGSVLFPKKLQLSQGGERGAELKASFVFFERGSREDELMKANGFCTQAMFIFCQTLPFHPTSSFCLRI